MEKALREFKKPPPAPHVVGQFDLKQAQAKENSEQVRGADEGIKPGVSAAKPRENVEIDYEAREAGEGRLSVCVG
jgi:hypothetical protein